MAGVCFADQIGGAAALMRPEPSTLAVAVAAGVAVILARKLR